MPFGVVLDGYLKTFIKHPFGGPGGYSCFMDMDFGFWVLDFR